MDPQQQQQETSPGMYMTSEGVQEKTKPEWRINLENWMVNEGPKV